MVAGGCEASTNGASTADEQDRSSEVETVVCTSRMYIKESKSIQFRSSSTVSLVSESVEGSLCYVHL